MEVIETPDGKKLLGDERLAEPLNPTQAKMLAQNLWLEVPKAEGRRKATITLPLADGTEVLMQGVWPLKAADFDHLVELLGVMRVGLVDNEDT